jgi:hypothetical protein
VRRSGEGQEPHRQGHPGGQLRAYAEERPLETRIRELNNELMRTYHSCDFNTDDLDDTHTRL